jgi:hypothetical protein
MATLRCEQICEFLVWEKAVAIAREQSVDRPGRQTRFACRPGPCGAGPTSKVKPLTAPRTLTRPRGRRRPLPQTGEAQSGLLPDPRFTPAT